jgi:hypothetical protein
MTQSSAENLANVAIGAACVGVAYYVIKTPSLRRLAWRLTLIGLTGTVPAWLRREIEQGWHESGRSSSLRSPGEPRPAAQIR